MLARAVLERAQDILLDVAGLRWPLPELARWLTDGLRNVVVQVPAANARTVTLSLAEGAHQELPDEYATLMRIIRNQAGSAVTIVDRALLDSTVPDWYSGRARAIAKHVMYDEASPRTFHVYPPNDGAGLLEAQVSVYPDPISDEGLEIEDYDMPLGLPDAYVTPLVDYVLYRAYSKDAQYAGAAQRAVMHLQAYSSALGVKVTIAANMSPNVKAGVANAAGGVD